jgi:hypothetical protein
MADRAHTTLWRVTLRARYSHDLESSVNDPNVRADGPVHRHGPEARRVFLVEGERVDAESLRNTPVGFGMGVCGEVEPARDGEYAIQGDAEPITVRHGRLGSF